ncbi:hypothetical protein PTKIN_Ptkin04bG0200700 [Pterospermum kingtungense]
MKMIWKLSKEVVAVAFEENLLLFKFQGERDKSRILEGARVYGLPLGMRNKAIGERIGKKIRHPIKVDNYLDSGGCGFFLRIRVEIDVTKPLRRAVKLLEGDGKKEIWGRITYKWLTTFCYSCGKLGHTDVDCDEGERVSDNVIS